jgi:hypothetical protein
MENLRNLGIESRTLVLGAFAVGLKKKEKWIPCSKTSLSI